jgi:hypothetical protein
VGKWITAGLVAVALGLLAWQMRPRAQEHGATPDAAMAGAPLVGDSTRAKKLLGAAAKIQEEAQPKKLRENGEEYIERIDEVYPRRLYGFAAQCYEGGIERDYKMKFAYKLRGENGVVRVTEVKLLESNFEDEKIEHCMRDAIANATWRDDEIPDFTDEDELLIRVRGIKKYLQSDDDSDDASGEPAGFDAP